MPPRQRRHPPSRRRTPSHQTTITCTAAALALVAVMGVTSLSGRNQEAIDTTWRTTSAAPAATLAPPPLPQPSPPPPRKAKHPLAVMKRAVEDVARRIPGIRGLERGPAFEGARVEALAALSTVRDDLGVYLDEHPSDDRANGLWDRLQALYVALKKL